MDRLMKEYPAAKLRASGLAVGLPEGQMGNSEVGHLNLGAGRVVYQDYTRINLAIEDGSFFENPVLKKAVAEAASRNATVHLMGLVSDGGVHSHLDHLFALLELCGREGATNVAVHAFLDGRDTPPRSAIPYLERLEKEYETRGLGATATVSGRYYAMDRDRRWERTKKAFDAIVFGEGLQARSALDAVEAAYARGENDEFVQPTVIESARALRVRPQDSIIFFNFRPDRARQLTRALALSDFAEFDRGDYVPDVHFVCMTEYDATFPLPIAFPPERLTNILADVLAAHGLRQLRIAETEKYAHVTFFFNGGEEEPRPLEERVLIPSPKVATYDLKPEMSAYEVTDEVVRRIENDRYDFILINYANSDMVGHTGVMEAAIRAVEVVDECVGRVVDATLARGGELIVTADHGNSDEMVGEGGGYTQTAHSTNPVPFIFVSARRRPRLREEGVLADVAPTILDALGIEKPAEMTGESMILKGPAAARDSSDEG
jgi:2,3-bisphosphoglycerate-independent phosphoglycerate mutase